MVHIYSITKYIGVMVLFFTAYSLQATYGVVANYTEKPIVVSYVDNSWGPLSQEKEIQPGGRFEMHSGSHINITGIDATQDIIVSEYGKEGWRGTSKKKRYNIPVGWTLGYSVCPVNATDPDLKEQQTASNACRQPWHG